MRKSILLFILMLMPLLANAVEIDGICYNLVSKFKTAEVTQNPNKYSGKVVIPMTVTYGGKEYNVTSIRSSAFADCWSLTSVSIPNSVTSIGSSAFHSCRSLTSVSIPNSVTSIGSSTFYDCRSLTTVTIPNNVISIGDDAFFNCKGLTSVTIPNSVISIGDNAFQYCSGLTSVTIPASVTTINSNLFAECINLKSVTIPIGVTSIGEGAFFGCSSLISVTIPNSVTKIGTEEDGDAFAYCTSLTSVIIPNSVCLVGRGSFSNCSSLISVTIGSEVKTICEAAFARCPELIDIYCYAEKITDIDPEEYDGDDYNGLNDGLYASPDAFEGSYIEYATLHVPKGCLDAYKAVNPWKNFQSIEEIVDAKVELNKTEATIEKGKTLKLKATITPSDLADKGVTWKSSNKKVATVSSSGKVKGVKAGTATITCTSNATGLKATCKVTVVNGLVTLNKTEAYVQKGKTMTLKATVTPETLTDKSVTWESSDKKIATVTKAGKVKGVKYGTATITCTSVATGAKATCQVTVGKVVIGTSEVTIKKSRETILIPFLYPEDLADKSVTWKSSDKSIATVDEEGRVKGIKAGTATITCTSVATGLKGTCTVTVLSNSEARSMIGDDDELTDIKELESSAVIEPFDVYDLSGRKVLHQVTSLDGLSEGIYIVNGKKILKK